jgi:site-specific recombinase XerD
VTFPLPALEPRALAPAQIRTLKNLLDRLLRFHQHKGRRRAPAGELHGPRPPAARDRAIMHLLLSNGLRRGELVTVDLDQLSPSTPDGPRAAKRAKINDARGTGRTSRHVSCPPTPAPRSPTTGSPPSGLL